MLAESAEGGEETNLATGDSAAMKTLRACRGEEQYVAADGAFGLGPEGTPRACPAANGSSRIFEAVRNRLNSLSMPRFNA